MARPTDPLEALAWVKARRCDLERIERKAMFDARMQGQFEQAIEVSGLSRKKAHAMTRQANRERGTMVRWNSR